MELETRDELAPVPFTIDLGLKGVGPEGQESVAVELADGDLLIEGWGANYDLDREDEAFEDGAFTKGIQKFLSGNAPLCYHHDYKTVIGKVVGATPVPGKGMWIKAIVDNQPEGSPWRHIYDGIKKGRINQFSCGGIFRRKMTESGPRIFDVDLLEWSTTPVAVGKGTAFSVVAGKALQAPIEGKAEGDLTEDEQKVVEAAREVGNPQVEPETGTPAEPAPSESEKDEEAETKEVIEEETAIADSTITAEQIAAGTITAEHIADGSITAEHFSDDLRSRFSELKPDPEPSLDDLAAALERLGSGLEQVASHVGVKVGEDEEGNVVAGREVTVNPAR